MDKDNKIYAKFEKLLEQKRKKDKKNYTIADVCRETGIAENAMSNWKTRGGSLSAKNLSLIADFLGVSTSYFFKD